MKLENLNFQASPFIRKILKIELSKGNSIAEISSGWPEKNNILIILQEPFSERYFDKNLVYREVDDPHYWKEEYFDKSSKQTLACKF